jgi:hypothetical protein
VQVGEGTMAFTLEIIPQFEEVAQTAPLLRQVEPVL